jgi:hypothetical protein
VSVALTPLLWLAIALVVISQIKILQSTVRAMRGAEAPTARRGIEWAYAIVPAVALAVALVATVQAARDHGVRQEMEARANQVAPQ